ncbi:MAG: HEAT repeat domain-containing protein, partial [Planctomycetes bacterium]|nr:HEAT repeat domain-containing protein [Planctomycetota bacterium]
MSRSFIAFTTTGAVVISAILISLFFERISLNTEDNKTLVNDSQQLSDKWENKLKDKLKGPIPAMASGYDYFLDHIREVLETSQNLSKLACQVRSQARTDKSFLDLLQRVLLNENEDIKLRQLIAIVLGSLEDEKVIAALLSALKQADSDDLKTLKTMLIYALGEFKGASDEDDRFEEDGPDTYKIEFGFSVIITGNLMDQDVRNSVLSCL